MKVIPIILIFVMFLAGCELFEKCYDYCDGNTMVECTNDGGLMGGKNYWDYINCEDSDQICVEFGKSDYPNCVNYSKTCTSGMTSYCKEKTVYRCKEKDGVFYEEFSDSCENSTYTEVCVEFDTEARCVIPVEKCNAKAEKVCFENSRVSCYEKDGSYYIQKSYYDGDCEEKECVELDNERTYCLTPTEFCFVSENSICIDDRPANCYQKDGKFFMSYVDYCYSDTVCVDLENEDAKCLEIISAYCDPDAESVCYEDAVVKCYENDGFYYIDTHHYCRWNDEDKCIYDPETKSAHCLSDEE